jgi:crotonobetainyl-CoA:carnitine CoA-transferase CaiB-like acyl-CoA transferase
MNRATSVPSAHPLSGYTVVELSSGIAGAYCTKLLADAGATVVKLEAPEGDPLRRWSASGKSAGARDQPLFRYLAAGKHSVVLDPADPGTRPAITQILSRADAAVWSPGSPLAELPGLAPARLAAGHPHLAVAALSPFGLTGPWAGRAATEFTLQAWSGGIIGLGRGTEDRAPFQIGGQVGEWTSGAYAAVALLTGRLGGRPGVYDVSQLEVDALTLTYYPVTFVDILGQPRIIGRRLHPPGVSSAKDGLIGIACGTLQQRHDLYAMAEHPEWSEDDALMSRPGEVVPVIEKWIAARTVDEIQQLAIAFRIPNAPVGHAASIPQWEQIRARHSLEPAADAGVTGPRPPYRLSSATLRGPAPAPSLGEHTATWTSAELGPARQAVPAPPGDLPLQGLRVLDLTAYWAGPLCTQTLALLGAEVIHVESTRRPDGGRLVSGVPGSATSWWERGAIHLGGNAAKKAVTLDFSAEAGKELLRELVKTCDVVVENFTPRVLDNAGLGYEALRALRPDLIMVRMSGFGLDGPWRDNAAFAYCIEDAAGLTWMTGYADAKPVEPYCIGDPNAGIHAVFALLVALENRTRTGDGALVDAAMIDAALNITAEQFIEYSANGTLLTRDGNRGPAAAPQNLYQAAGVDEYGRDDVWVALAVADDQQWAALRRALGEPDWAADPRLATAAGRRERHDLIDEQLRPWFRARSAEEAVEQLWPAGVPVAPVVQPHRQIELEQLAARGFYEKIEHPVAGTYRQSTLPFRWPGAPGRIIRRHAPLMGEHNEEVLTGIGVTASQLARLEADGIIGRAPYGQA